MSQKSSSLTGPLWVIAIGILILGIGACFMAYMLWDAKQSHPRPATASPASPDESRQPAQTNPEPIQSRALPPATRPAQPAGTVVNPSTALAPVEPGRPPAIPATVVLPPRSSPASNLPAVSGGALSRPLGGVIYGQAVLKGNPPAELPLPIDAVCGALHPPAQRPTTRFYVTNSDGGLADVFVYLRSGTDGRKYPEWANKPVIDQRGCVFTPQVIGLQTGQTMIVRNSDPLLHNNHFTPAVQGNPEINKAQMPRGADQVYTWNQPEIFLRLKCDVHPWMFAYIGVVDHPFFAVTDANGRYELPAPPPGRYVIEAVHRKTHQRAGNGLQREFNLGANEILQIDFEVTVPMANQ